MMIDDDTIRKALAAIQLRFTYSDAFAALTTQGDNGTVLVPDCALVHYVDGWRQVARFRGMGDPVRMTNYTIDPFDVLRRLGEEAEHQTVAEDDAEVERLRSENKLMALYILGISPDANTQTVEEFDAQNAKVEAIARAALAGTGAN